MFNLLMILAFAGLLAGMIQYLVDFKKLPIAPDPAPATAGEGMTEFWKFVKDHWEIFGYAFIGVAGALLVPLLHELTPLKGLETIKDTIKKGEKIDAWVKLVLLGYGIVLGYSAVRLLRSVATLLLGRLTQSQQTQQAVANARISEVERTLSAALGQNQLADFNSIQPAANLGDDYVAQDVGTGLTTSAVCIENPGPWTGKPWRTAESLKKLLAQVNALAPSRLKASDGTIGDMNHQATRSDHNPWVLDVSTGIVTAIDITHDPAHQCDCNILATSLENGKDSRVKYVIWNKRIMNSSAIGGAAAWTWRPYTGANPHDKHIHISVQCDKPSYDSTAAWTIKTI